MEEVNAYTSIFMTFMSCEKQGNCVNQIMHT